MQGRERFHPQRGVFDEPFQMRASSRADSAIEAVPKRNYGSAMNERADRAMSLGGKRRPSLAPAAFAARLLWLEGDGQQALTSGDSISGWLFGRGAPVAALGRVAPGAALQRREARPASP